MRNYLLLFIIGLTTTLQAQMMLPTYQAVQYKNSGIVLPSVTIGTQIWMTKNLDVTTYRDGTPIPQVTDQTVWSGLTTGAWCYSNNDPANGLIYGKLYNWYAVAGIHDNDPNTPNKILAPLVYHIPTDGEWTTLANYLGGDGLAGGKLKESGFTHWNSPNTGATNSSGFTGLPAGNRLSNKFDEFGLAVYFWSSTSYTTNLIYYLQLHYGWNSTYRSSYYKLAGFSVRCVKD
jgi:uncharacterized protein (TIGR02145 family)